MNQKKKNLKIKDDQSQNYNIKKIYMREYKEGYVQIRLDSFDSNFQPFRYNNVKVKESLPMI